MEQENLSKHYILGIPTVICLIFFIGTIVLSFILEDKNFVIVCIGCSIMHFLEFFLLVICYIKEKFQLYFFAYIISLIATVLIAIIMAYYVVIINFLLGIIFAFFGRQSDFYFPLEVLYLLIEFIPMIVFIIFSNKVRKLEKNQKEKFDLLNNNNSNNNEKEILPNNNNPQYVPTNNDGVYIPNNNTQTLLNNNIDDINIQVNNPTNNNIESSNIQTISNNNSGNNNI